MEASCALECRLLLTRARAGSARESSHGGSRSTARASVVDHVLRCEGTARRGGLRIVGRAGCRMQQLVDLKEEPVVGGEDYDVQTAQHSDSEGYKEL